MTTEQASEVEIETLEDSLLWLLERTRSRALTANTYEVQNAAMEECGVIEHSLALARVYAFEPSS